METSQFQSNDPHYSSPGQTDNGLAIVTNNRNNSVGSRLAVTQLRYSSRAARRQEVKVSFKKVVQLIFYEHNLRDGGPLLLEVVATGFSYQSTGNIQSS